MSDKRHPWLKFYPADWRANAKLRMCSLAARGLWMEMLCLMHEAEPRGQLTISGKIVTVSQLASLVGMSTKQVGNLVQELDTNGVLERQADGLISSRRMLRDTAKAEQDQENGRLGGNPKVTTGVNPTLKAKKPDTRDQKDRPLRGLDRSAQGFDSFWSVVPRKTGKDAAEKAYRQKIAAGRATPSEILAGAIRWRDEAKHDDPQYVPHPATWLNRGGWEDEPRSQQARAGPRGAAPASRPSHLSVLLKDLGHDQQPPQHQDSRPFINAEPARSEPFDRSLRHAQPSRAESERGDLLSLERRSERQRASMDDG